MKYQIIKQSDTGKFITDETEVKIIRLSKLAFQTSAASSFLNLTEIIFHSS